MDTQTISEKCSCSKPDKEWYYHDYTCPVFIISERLNRVEEDED